MGRLCLIELDGRFYSCHSCRTHLANFDQLMSKAFHCRHGKAYLFNTVVNVFEGPLEERMMTTGVHTVADIYCKGCQQNVGWKYEFAQHKAQKYKEGKFILERGRIVGCEKGDFYLETQAIGSDPDDVPLE
ncbi:hypothetical protein SELMODRAFT_268836 [Selaginella moellendorffii]|uniref:Protein yippee-like n=1 Tax=Selaginella moellendorffii TaxID=88036 RepID=D8SLK0_SELML|nr:protein yippee-like At5g53940 isoform X3 [Selaginella moellendorffii]EFJ14674.1 hypothetical protein SELMODRAFT_268836 [Selaginella moellendorffii]|eukprot:XP_002984164.1 protein yippee-like At5g53940 isoform X3 [Selaginella moellendorffii]